MRGRGTNGFRVLDPEPVGVNGRFGREVCGNAETSAHGGSVVGASPYNRRVMSADDLRHFLEVARRQRLVAAGVALGVDHTTVGRRVSRLERALGQRLFDRSAAGWTLTEAGRNLLPHAETVESALIRASEDTPRVGEGASGTVRIATPDGFGSFLLMPALGPLRARNPGLDVELVTASRTIALGMRDFDIAVTLEEPSPRFAHRLLTDYVLRLYATPGYLDRNPPIRDRKDLHAHTLIWYVDDLLDVAPLRFLGQVLPGLNAQIQTNNLTAQWTAAAASLGIAILPTYVARTDPRLVPVLPDEVQVRRGYWLTVPRDLARLARITAVTDLLDTLVRERRDDLFG